MKRIPLLAGAAVSTALAVLCSACSAGNSTASSDKSSAPAASSSSSAPAGASAGSSSAPVAASGASSAVVTNGVSWNAPTASLKGVTLTYWSATQTATMADQVIKAFEAATGATINKVIIPDVYETNAPTKLATGAKPDLATWQPTGSELALLKPATGLQDLSSAPWLSKINPSTRTIGQIDGKNYAALVNLPSLIGIFYNKADFAKAGITTTPKNFTELLADAKKIKATGVAPFFGGAGDKWPTQWWPQVQVAEAAKAGLWDRVNTNKDTFGGKDLLGAITTFEGMVKDGLFNADDKTSTYTESGPALLKGSSAMVLQISSFVSLMQSTADTATIDKTVGFFPISKDGNIATVVPGGDNALVAFKTGDAKREAAARQFLRFWMETDYSSYIAAAKVVSLETAVPSPPGVPELAKTAAASISNSVGSMQSLAAVNPDFYVYLADMVNGTKSPADVAKATQSQFVQLAQALGVKGF
jgi:raffinose/stachyose/melibiose transport system substrate-binding protein